MESMSIDELLQDRRVEPVIFVFKNTGEGFKIWSEDGHVKNVKSNDEIIEFVASIVEDDKWELYESIYSFSSAHEIVLRLEGRKYKFN